MTARFTVIILLAFVAGATALACESGITTPVHSPPPGDPDRLKEKDGALFLIMLLFNEYDASEYDRLLDTGFVYFFGEADYSAGRTPEWWSRAIEVTAYDNFFDSDRSEDRVISRSLKLTYPSDNWTEITPDDPVQYPDESWYFTTVGYDMSVVIDGVPEVIYEAKGLRAEIIIRWDKAAGHYRLIRWRDDAGGLLRSSLARSATGQWTTWGQVKALYN
jgi:hypothetical protein